jgi:hypothetical protein
MASKKTTKKSAASDDTATTFKVFDERPSNEAALLEVERFFDALAEGEVEAAGAAIAHQGKDFWPHQVRSLWQDLVVPVLEDEGEDVDIDDDKTWRKLAWLESIGFEKEAHWDDDEFYVNVTYDGEVTDVSAEFSLAKRPEGWVVQRKIMHIA